MRVKMCLKNTAIMTVMCVGLMSPMAVYAEPDTFQSGDPVNCTEKEVPLYRSSLTEEDTFTCYFFEDMPNVPYVSYEDFVETFFKLDLTVTDQGSGKYSVVKKDVDGNTYTAILDTEKETLIVGNNGLFFSVSDEKTDEDGRSDEVPFINKRVSVTEDGTLKDKTYDYSKYGIDLRTVDDAPVVPLASISDLYGNTNGTGTIVIYNGEKIYFNGTSLMLDCGLARNSDYELVQPLIDGNRSEDMIEFNYRELCVVIDNMYGFPNPSYPFAKKVSEAGLDAALTAMDPQTKEYLLSSDSTLYMAGLNRLLTYWLCDGGHTGIGFSELVTSITDDPTNLNREKNYEFLRAILPIISAGNGTVAWQENADLINYERMYDRQIANATYPELRAEAYGIDQSSVQGVVYKGDTAVIYFNNFTYDGQGWVDYYNAVDQGQEGVIPQDTYGFFQTTMREISTDHPEIKNIVIDDSLNGGGVDVAMLGIEELLFGSHAKEMLNQGTGITTTMRFTFDQNLDGVFDEKDAAVDYSKYHYAVLESMSSFSCGNLFPAFAKEHGILILGETSGGGSCSVAFHATADGMLFQMSSEKELQGKAAIDGVLDKGVAPDKVTFVTKERQNELLAAGDYDELKAEMLKGYDIDAMSEAINQFYGETSYKNEWQKIDGKWYFFDKEGLLETNAYRQGYYLTANGAWDGKAKATGWKQDSKGWRYSLGGKNYLKNGWKKIDGKWYFFDKEGLMEANAYRQGYYFTANGAWDGKAKAAGWKQDSKGWWYSLGGKNYLKNGWKKIDGKWYYFKANGYIAVNEFVQGWWLDRNGVQSDPVKYSWHKTGKGWWYGAAGGWYAKGKAYTIDGVSYKFDKNGYCTNP